MVNFCAFDRKIVVIIFTSVGSFQGFSDFICLNNEVTLGSTAVYGSFIYGTSPISQFMNSTSYFTSSYTEEKFNGDIPRWNFNDFGRSCMMIFRILCGEWIEPLYDCMRATSPVSFLFFLTALVIGNFLVSRFTML